MNFMAMTWDQVRRQSPLWLNLGGHHHSDPHPEYRGYIAIDRSACDGKYVLHDLTRSFPLSDDCVDRLHAEDVLHFLEPEDAQALLGECYRILKSGCRLRISVPDYHHPKDRRYAHLARDPRHPAHRMMTTYASMRLLLAHLPFRTEFLRYWDGDYYVERPIDPSLGPIQRTTERDPRNRPSGVGWSWTLRNLWIVALHGFRMSPLQRKTLLRGQPWHVTALVVDCIKP